MNRARVMMFATTLLSQARKAPISLLLSCFALLFFAAPELGHHFEFRFADCHTLNSRVAASVVFTALAPVYELSQSLKLIGCNWLHWSAEHLFWDVLMFYGVGSVCEKTHWRSYVGTTVTAALLIPVIVAWVSPELQSYRGLSGIDTALFALLATSRLISETRERNWRGGLLFGAMLVGMVTKVSLELVTQQVFFVSSENFTPVPIAHLAGGVTGLLAACLFNNNSNSSRNGKFGITGTLGKI